ncbi:MAG TPA: hypothetical protein VGM84_24055 [Steroidobacteraceae bacterium]|jgi:hypothetical protein
MSRLTTTCSRRLAPIAALAAIAASTLLTTGTAHAQFTPPYGLNGHMWGEPLKAFPGLMVWHANTAQNSPGKVTSLHINCQQLGNSSGVGMGTGSGTLQGICGNDISTFTESPQGDGSFALGEYYQDVDANPWSDGGVQLTTISYLYCANSRSPYLPTPLRDNLQLCGTRIIFTSDTLAQLDKQPAGHRSNFDLLMRHLTRQYGEPPGYEVYGKVTIEGVEESSSVPSAPTPTKPKYVVYRWCGLQEASRDLHPPCKASIVVEFDAVHGVGTVLYATSRVYDFAYARYVMGDQNNDLYTLLFSRHLDRALPRMKPPCTGTRICSPVRSGLSSKDLGDFAQTTAR